MSKTAIAAPSPLDCTSLPCADCGQAVAVSDAGTTVKVERVVKSRVEYVPTSKCRACVARDDDAAELVRRHLAGGLVVGDRRYGVADAVRLMIDARTALDAAGIEPTAVQVAESPAALLASEITHLHNVARGLRWRDRLSPPASLVAERVRLVLPGSPNRQPWEHLDGDDCARVREGAAKVLADRVAHMRPSVALKPPALPGNYVHRGTPVVAACLYCGTASVERSALFVTRNGGEDVAGRKVWTLRQVNPVSLGARRGGPAQLVGWLCPACERAAASAGSASSASALEEALSASLGVSRRTLSGDEIQVIGLRAWGALVADAIRNSRPEPAPNSEPWGHLPRNERDRLADDWRRGGS